MGLKVVLLLFLNAIIMADGKRILLMPAPYSSHVNYYSHVGDMLHETYKHEIYMVLPDNYPLNISDNFKRVTYKARENFYAVTKNADAKMMEKAWMELHEKSNSQNFFAADPPLLAATFVQDCLAANEDQQFFQTLKSLKLDLIIYDLVVGYRCYGIVPYRLGIPYAGLVTVSVWDPWCNRSPYLPSFVPFRFSTTFSEKMDFWERVQNVIAFVDWSAIVSQYQNPFLDKSFVARFAPEMPYLTLDEILAKCLLVMINTNPLLENAQPHLPNMIEVGGLTAIPGKPLPPDFTNKIAEAKLGTIVVSFGSVTDMLPMDCMQKLADAFWSFPDYTIIWKYTGSSSVQNLAPNIKLLKWLPQNDLLAHNSTRLFITHCGNNGQFEAMYHAVPMIGFPIFADQTPNAARIVYNGYGTQLEITTFTADDLVEQMNNVLNNPKYLNNVRKASKIFRSQKHPLEKAGHWINHVMRFGGKHLHAYNCDIPWYQYLMLDILVLVCFVVTLFIASLSLCLKITRRLL